MKKIIPFIALVSILSFVFSACSKETKEPLTNNSNNATYENVIFDNLKTFTEVTGATLNSTNEDKTNETTFCYVVFENAEQKITDYKTYLLESGYAITSALDAETIVFNSDEKEIRITSENGDAGTSISITIPCDEATNNARKDKVYQEMLAAVEKKDFKEVLNITDRFSSDEIKNYKDVYAYRLFSIAMRAYNVDIYGEASEYFKKYCEQDKTDKLDAKSYIKKCDSILSKYNGTYSGKSFNGYVPYSMFIKDGRVALEFNNAELLGNSYKKDSVYYLYDLRIQETDGKILLYIVDYTLGDIDYKHKLTQLDSGAILVNDNSWDMLKGYHNDTSSFAGEYKKTSSNTPSAK